MAYDWALMKREFVRGYKDDNNDYIPEPTLKQIAKRHGCSYDYLRRKAAPKNENWEQERQVYVTKKSQRVTEKEIEIISDELVDLDNNTLNAAKEGIKKVISRLVDSDVSNHDILKLSAALLDFQKAYKNVFGEPTDHTQNTNKTFIDDRRDKLKSKMKNIEAQHEQSNEGDKPETPSSG